MAIAGKLGSDATTQTGWAMKSFAAVAGGSALRPIHAQQLSGEELTEDSVEPGVVGWHFGQQAGLSDVDFPGA